MRVPLLLPLPPPALVSLSLGGGMSLKKQQLTFFFFLTTASLPSPRPPFPLDTRTVYQGLIPWAWIEASTKGAVLLFAAAEIEGAAMGAGMGHATAGLLGGMGGGIAQAYATVGTFSNDAFPPSRSPR